MHKKQIIFSIATTFLSILIHYIFFFSVLTSTNIYISFAINPFNLIEKFPKLWLFIKCSYFFILIIPNYMFLNSLSKGIFKSEKRKKLYNQNLCLPNDNSINLYLGKNINNEEIYLNEKSLYQNILITGTIGTGKTSSAMYPFTEQLIKYNYDNQNLKLPMLILDVKGNYYKQVYEYAKKYNRENDILTIEINGNIKYNPLDKPNLKASILANRLKTILLLFSQNNSESYWLDKAEDVLCECIKYCRLYNNGYVDFNEIHKLITIPNYFYEKLDIIKKLFLSNYFSQDDNFNLLSCINFFEKEFTQLDSRTLSILKSEITRITNCFISDYNINNTFCPKQNEKTSFNFKDVINKGKIVILNMNISEYKNISKIIAAYLKLDFQSEVLSRLSYQNYIKPVVFISDEYHEYVTTTDSTFFAQSRESKCINIIATQSYTSLLNTLNNQSATKVITQNLVNKLWFRTDDIFTIEDAQKQIGKEEKLKTSTTVSENANETKYNYFTNTFNSKKSNLSESFNSYFQSDFKYDTNFFTQDLETFTCLSFLSNGNKILSPQKINMQPYFINERN